MFDLILKHWILLIILSLSLALLWLVAMLNKYVRLMLNIVRDTPMPPVVGSFDFERIEGKPINFRAFDGTKLKGMFLTAKSLPQHLTSNNTDKSNDRIGPAPESRGVIIFCHEFGCDMYSCARYCLGLLREGFDIFTFDFRSHGNSSSLPGYQPRLWCTDKEISDCRGAIRFVKEQLESQNRDVKIGLFGISRGAGAAIMAASKTQSQKIVKAVLTDSAFSTDTTMEWSMKKWAHIFAKVRFMYANHSTEYWRFLRWLLIKCAQVRFRCRFPSARKTLKQIKGIPIFFIHGKKDSYIRPAQAEILFNASPKPHYLWIVAQAKHNQAVEIEPKLYSDRTTAFFEKYLNGNKIGYGSSNLAASAKSFFDPDENVDMSNNPSSPPLQNKEATTQSNVETHTDKTAGSSAGTMRHNQHQQPTKTIRKTTASMPRSPE